MRLTTLQYISYFVLSITLPPTGSVLSPVVLPWPHPANRTLTTRPADGNKAAGILVSGRESLAEDGPDLLRLQAVADTSASKEHGAEVYQGNCAACHGADRTGVPPAFPSLIDVSKRFSDVEIAKQIREGKGRMPAFPDMSDPDLNSLLLLLKTPKPDKTSKP